MSKVTILALEDTVDRMRWLKTQVNGEASIFWAKTVKEFRELLTSIGHPSLIILDHDLGPDNYTNHGCDSLGETGSDAVRYLVEHPDVDNLAANTAVLVWSANTAHGERMAFDLIRAGFSARNLAFLDGNKRRLAEIVRAFVGGQS